MSNLRPVVTSLDEYKRLITLNDNEGVRINFNDMVTLLFSSRGNGIRYKTKPEQEAVDMKCLEICADELYRRNQLKRN